MEKHQISGGSLIAFGIIFLILYLLFPVFTVWLLWLAIFVMLMVGIISLLLNP